MLPPVTLPPADLDAALTWVASVLGPVASAVSLTGGRTSAVLAVTPVTGEPAVLRVVTQEPWRTHGAALTAREAATQRLLEDTVVPAPRSLALDADGAACGHPAHLMTLLPGRVDVDRRDPASLDALADLLASVHAVPPDASVRRWQSWAWPAKRVVPAWAADPGVWWAAFEVLAGPEPAYEDCFLHRDPQPLNVLWDGDRVGGLVDWVETSVGPAWLDVAHCAGALALRHGGPVADAFTAAYERRTGRAPQPFFEVVDLVGLLPAGEREGFVTDPGERRRLEERLAAVLRRLG